MMKLFRMIEFVWFYLRELLVSNLRVAYDVLTVHHHMKPQIIELSVSHLSDKQLLIASNLISMTPGTLSLDVSDDREVLYVHAMYVDDVDALVQHLEVQYIRRVRRVF